MTLWPCVALPGFASGGRRGFVGFSGGGVGRPARSAVVGGGGGWGPDRDGGGVALARRPGPRRPARRKRLRAGRPPRRG